MVHAPPLAVEASAIESVSSDAVDDVVQHMAVADVAVVCMQQGTAAVAAAAVSAADSAPAAGAAAASAVDSASVAAAAAAAAAAATAAAKPAAAAAAAPRMRTVALGYAIAVAAIFAMACSPTLLRLMPAETPPLLKMFDRLVVLVLLQLPLAALEWRALSAAQRQRVRALAPHAVLVGVLVAVNYSSYAEAIDGTSLMHAMLLTSMGPPLLFTAAAAGSAALAAALLARRAGGGAAAAGGSGSRSADGAALAADGADDGWDVEAVAPPALEAVPGPPPPPGIAAPPAAAPPPPPSPLPPPLLSTRDIFSGLFWSARFPSALELAGAAVGIAAAAVIILAGADPAGDAPLARPATLYGDAQAVLNSASICLYLSVLAVLREAGFPPFLLLLPANAVAALLLAALLLAAGTPLCCAGAAGLLDGWASSGATAGLVIAMGVVPGLIGHGGMTIALRIVTPLSITLLSLNQIWLAILLGAAVGAQGMPSVVTLAAAPVVAGAALLAILGSERAKRARAAAAAAAAAAGAAGAVDAAAAPPR